jgi:hypothetical protein
MTTQEWKDLIDEARVHHEDNAFVQRLADRIEQLEAELAEAKRLRLEDNNASWVELAALKAELAERPSWADVGELTEQVAALKDELKHNGYALEAEATHNSYLRAELAEANRARVFHEEMQTSFCNDVANLKAELAEANRKIETMKEVAAKAQAVDAPNDYEFGGVGKSALKAQEPTLTADVLAFLRGAAPLDGVWFGDPHLTEKSRFWWRKYLTTQPVAQAQEPVAWCFAYNDTRMGVIHSNPSMCKPELDALSKKNGVPVVPLFTAPPPSAEDAKDAARYRWLCEDHDERDVREHRNEILRRMPVMSYSAASTAIDAAMKGEG